MDQVADILEAEHDALLKRWIARVGASLAPSPATTPEFTDHMPAFLREVIATLREPACHPATSPVDGQSAVGREHGAQRFRLGFELEAVVREYGLLMHLVLDLIEEAGASVSIREVRLFNDLVTSAVAKATAEYARRLAASVQASMARQNERLSQLEAPAIIGHVAGPSHVVSFANRGLTQLIGGRPLAGLPLAQAIPELEGQPLLGLLDRAYASGQPLVARETSASLDRTGDGAVCEGLFDLVVQPTRDAAGEVDGILVHAVEVTEQHRAFEALQRSEENFRALAETLPDAVWAADAQGRILWTNSVLPRATGLSPEAIRGDGYRDLVHRDDALVTMPAWGRALETGEPMELQHRVRQADGSFRWHLVRGRPARDANGTIYRWMGTSTDIHEQRERQAELERRHDFEQHLVGIVSHDLRNPLSAILLGATGLLETEEQSEWATKIVLRIRSSAERAARMISDLLDFTQARLGGGIRLERRPADLYALASTALDEVEATYPDRALELTRAGDIQGTWDADRIVQVVTNLVTNALKYSPVGTPVTVRAAGHNSVVELTVHNEGPPIPPERLDRLFEPLQRATDQLDRKTRSVGLGLYIVNAIVRAHGGTVGVVSTAEAGTTFTVRLPREPGARLPG